jgi:Tol biopolymer transport system component/tRNA A-37 threonylcarbamoyl transferase component Bud32
VIPTLVGSTIGQYTVSATLGEGGMGVVYKARDTKLGRTVALKVLSAATVADGERKRRFMQEARTASALNHQNIVTIYEVNQADGVDFIAMEYIPGRTLDSLIGSRGLPLPTALKYAVQMADALAVAHAAGVVHRDLKPANVMVSDRGLVKVLDFGVAKLTEPAHADESAATRTHEAPLTAEGTVLGTFAYMSPEQAEGRAVDARSDIFSFGSVLYEMVSGQPAFKRATRAATLTAILREEPRPLTEVVADADEDLHKLISRCLRKDPARRIQTMSDLKVALEELAAGTPSRVPAPAATGGPKLAYLWAALVVAAVAVGAAVAGIRWPTWLQPPTLPPVRTVPVTSFEGDEWEPTFSPDGQQVAFAWNGREQRNFDIYVMQVGGATPLRLTSDPAGDGYPAWSPDGREIAFVRSWDDKAAILVIGALGGPERTLAEGHVAGPLSWAAKGERLAFASRGTPQEPWRVEAVSLDTLDRQALTSPPAGSMGDLGLAYSPDGRQLAFVRWMTGATRDVYAMALPGGVPVRLPADTRSIGSICWTADAREIVFEASVGYGQLRLRRMPAAGGKSEPVHGVSDGAAVPAVAARGHRLAYVQASYNSHIHRIDLTEQQMAKRSSRRLIASTRFEGGPAISPDGTRIAFTSVRSGSAQIWLSNSEGTLPVQLTNLEADAVGSPSWSPDGRLIAFDSTLASNADVFVISPEARQPRRVTTEASEDMLPSWSSDGRSLYFGSNRSGEWQVWKTPVEGGPAAAVTSSGVAGYESPDGKYLYLATRFQEPALRRVPVAGGPEEVVLAQIPHWGAWTLTERGVYYVDQQAKPRPSIEFLDLATRKTRRVALFHEGLSPGDASRGLSVSPDEKWLVYVGAVWGDTDIMMVDHFR